MAAELNYGGLDMLPRVFVPDSAWFNANKRCETFILLAKS